MAQTIDFFENEDLALNQNKNMKSQKQKLKESIESQLLQSDLKLTEHQAHKSANRAAEVGFMEVISSTTEFANLNMTLSLEYEQNRVKFREHIEYIQTETEKLMKELTKMGLVYFEKNPKTNKPELKGRSTATTGVVKFLNALNEQVLDFYENVYKLQPDGKIQTSLFPNDV
jgi:hypothetical protein